MSKKCVTVVSFDGQMRKVKLPEGAKLEDYNKESPIKVGENGEIKFCGVVVGSKEERKKGVKRMGCQNPYSKK